MDLFVYCFSDKPREIQECAALNFVYSCPGSPDMEEPFFLGSNNWQKKGA